MWTFHFSFEPKVTGSLVTRLGNKTCPNVSRGIYGESVHFSLTSGLKQTNQLSEINDIIFFTIYCVSVKVNFATSKVELDI